MLVLEPAGLGARGPWSMPALARTDLGACEPRGMRAWGFAGQGGLRALVPLGNGASVLRGKRAMGPAGLGACGPWGMRAMGHAGYWTFGPLWLRA